MDVWKKNDWIIMGSSGFWEIMRHHSKGCVDKIKDVRFPEALNNAKKKNPKLPATYDKKDPILAEILENIMMDSVNKRPAYSPEL